MRTAANRRAERLAACALLAAGAAPAGASAQGAGCDGDCLARTAESYMEALVEQEHERLPWADVVRFTEDQVSMMVGDALWGSISSRSEEPFVVVDEQSGNAAWFGWVEEHGAPAYYGMRLRVDDGRIAEIETVVAREEEPGPFSEDVHGFDPGPAFDAAVPEAERAPRERLVDIAAGHYSTLQMNDGTLFTHYADDCEWVENGASVTHDASGDPQGCRARLELGLFRPVDRVRDRRFPLVNEEKGIVVAFSTRDISNRRQTWTTNDGRERSIDDVIYFPHSRGTMDMFKIRDGRITRIETLSNFLPYYMPSPWMDGARLGVPNSDSR